LGLLGEEVIASAAEGTHAACRDDFQRGVQSRTGNYEGLGEAEEYISYLIALYV
jgi:hypothetical protein